MENETIVIFPLTSKKLIKNMNAKELQEEMHRAYWKSDEGKRVQKKWDETILKALNG